MPEWLVYILVIALTTFLVRALPFLLIRGPIRSPRLRAFLEMVPYATLAAMAFPDMALATSSIWTGMAGFVTALVIAWFDGGLFKVAAGACGMVLLMELLL